MRLVCRCVGTALEASSLQIQRVSRRRLRGRRFDTLLLVFREFGSERVGHLDRDIGLYREDVVELALVGFRPQVRAGAGVDQLCRHADATARIAHAAFHDGFDTERIGDLADRQFRPRILQHRRAGNDVQ